MATIFGKRVRGKKEEERDEEGQVDISLSKHCLRELSRVQYPHGAPPYLYRTALCLFRLLCNCVVWGVRCKKQGVTEEQGRGGEGKGTRYDSRQN